MGRTDVGVTTAVVPICCCAFSIPEGWPEFVPLGDYRCRCGGMKAVGYGYGAAAIERWADEIDRRRDLKP